MQCELIFFAILKFVVQEKKSFLFLFLKISYCFVGRCIVEKIIKLIFYYIIPISRNTCLNFSLFSVFIPRKLVLHQVYFFVLFPIYFSFWLLARFVRHAALYFSIFSFGILVFFLPSYVLVNSLISLLSGFFFFFFIYANKHKASAKIATKATNFFGKTRLFSWHTGAEGVEIHSMQEKALCVSLQ